MTNDEIELRLDMKVRAERKVTLEVIELISMIDQRRIYLERGYPSLFAYLTQKYKAR